MGAALSLTVRATGYPAPALAESGPLPDGLSFTDNGNGTAVIAGTPAADSGGGPLTGHHHRHEYLGDSHPALHDRRLTPPQAMTATLATRCIRADGGPRPGPPPAKCQQDGDGSA